VPDWELWPPATEPYTGPNGAGVAKPLSARAADRKTVAAEIREVGRSMRLVETMAFFQTTAKNDYDGQ